MHVVYTTLRLRANKENSGFLEKRLRVGIKDQIMRLGYEMQVYYIA
jgi:hypothetical protein